MKIEILFPEYCNLFGDVGNVKYLKQCLPDSIFIDTFFNSEPTFLKDDINLIYMGPMTELTQEKIIKKFMPYKQRIKELIDNGTVFLFTGNAVEILGNYIENDDGSKIECLNIFNFYSKRNMMHRYGGLVLGKFNEIDIVGFKAQFTMSYGDNLNSHFIKVERGIGINKKSNLEGFVQNNFFGTYLIGPLLVLNPLFTKYLLEKAGQKNPQLPYENEIMDAYYRRLEDFKNHKVGIH